MGAYYITNPKLKLSMIDGHVQIGGYAVCKSERKYPKRLPLQIGGMPGRMYG